MCIWIPINDPIGKKQSTLNSNKAMFTILNLDSPVLSIVLVYRKQCQKEFGASKSMND